MPLFIAPKAEGRTPDELIARDGRAPMPFDVRHNKLGTLKVATRITMERIRQIPAQKRLLPHVYELTNAKGLAEDANIGVYPHYDNVVDATMLKQIEHFLPVVTDRILWMDLD